VAGTTFFQDVPDEEGTLTLAADRVSLRVLSEIANRFCQYFFQEMCPWNVKFSRDGTELAFVAREVIAGKDAQLLAKDILAMTQEELSTAFPKSPVKRATLRGLHRNAEVVLENLSASESKRRWADDKFIQVLNAVREQHPYLPIVVIGLPSEQSSVEYVAASANALAAATPGLRDALALVGTSNLVFTADTSISHAASAFNKPAVVLLKREHHPYAPWKIGVEIVFWEAETIHGLSSQIVTHAVLRLVGTRNDQPAVPM
jgi:hypothetical protein